MKIKISVFAGEGDTARSAADVAMALLHEWMSDPAYHRAPVRETSSTAMIDIGGMPWHSYTLTVIYTESEVPE